jgi:hypothetical protein
MKIMIDWYYKILQQVRIVSNLDLQLSSDENRLTSTLQKILNDFDIPTLTVQIEDLTFSDFRGYLDVLIQAFPEWSEHFGPQSL